MSGRFMEDYMRGMREYEPQTCWWLLSGSQTCILPRGHDNRGHELPALKARARRTLRRLRENIAGWIGRGQQR